MVHNTGVTFLAGLAMAILLAFLTGCDRGPGPTSAPSTTPPVQSGAAVAPTQPTEADSAPVIIALGDSLTAGFGLAEEDSYPARLETLLREAGFPHRIVNAGVSGDTSAGGRARMDWLLRQHPEIVIVALGGNDGLRGLPPEALRENLASIIDQTLARGVRVLLAGMRIPRNYGQDYVRRFEAVYPELAKRNNLPYLPFLLEGVALRGDLNLADGMHPNAKGAAIVARNVWRVLEPMLDQ